VAWRLFIARTRAACSTEVSSNTSPIPTIGRARSKSNRLYNDKPLVIRVLVLYIGMFTSFVADPTYYLHGIDRTGLHPVD
jgi:hypothetical protein